LTRVYYLLLDQSLYDGGEQFYYSAIGDVEVLAIHPDTLDTAIEHDPLIYKDLFSEAGHHLHTCVSNLENMAMDSTLQRVAHQLLFLAKKFGIPTEAGTSIQVPLTHQDIADILGVTRETVTRAMTTLRNQQLIQTGEHIVVCDQERLAAAAYRGEM
jgi:CRP/FNR family transcriptional regulator